MNTVLFDLDGTLTDPKIGITTCIQHALEQLGYDAPETDALLWCIGPPLTVSFAQLMQTDAPALINRAISHYRDRFATVGLYENLLYPDIPETLESVRNHGYQIFLATSKPHIYAKRIVEHFGLTPWFHGIYGSELDGTRSHKAELISHILQSESLSAAETIMVGDRYHDVVGAKQNQLLAIGVTYGYGTESELSEHGADHIATSPLEIAQILLNLD